MMHTILKFLKCRWFISQNIAQYNLQTNKTVDVKIRENLQ